ncbi:MAG TPA: DUF454 domain-containing protein [Sedimenticola sp.]|nr:DUF454 domain-containing protein [Sedimenticola sp.]
MPKYLLILIGCIFVGLAGLGAVLPVLPTTPFLLVAAACFAKSSERLYCWLLDAPLFGPLIRNWRETRSIPRQAKRLAITAIVLVGGSSAVFFVDKLILQLFILAILVLHIIFIARIQSTEDLILAQARSKE